MIVEHLNQEDTPVNIRIQLRQATVKTFHSRLQEAYRKDDVRLVGLIPTIMSPAAK